MMKAWLVSVLIILIFVGVYVTDLFAILGSNTFKYIAVFLVVATLAAARIILGNPLKKDDKNEENDN